MKKLIIPLLVLFMMHGGAGAQVFQVDTLQYMGDVNKYINIVILGDGYTSAEQAVFVNDATGLANYLLTTAPWANYSNYFNVFAIEVISAQSGAIHPNTAPDCSSASPLVPVSNPNNYFGSTFDYANIHRLVVPTNTGNLMNVLAANFPNYDQILVVVNSPYYGGSGGFIATSTTDPNADEVTVHEVGHSFGNLADEYWVGDAYAGEAPNMTQQTNPALVKWKNWYGINGVGIYQHCCGGTSSFWYKPHTGCKMEMLNVPFCSVCIEAIIESVHGMVNTIVSYSPLSAIISTPDQYIDFRLTELMLPVPNTLKIVWKLDGNVIANNVDSVMIDQSPLSLGNHVLQVNVTDTTSLINVDNHATVHFSVVTWTIDKTNVGIRLSGSENKIACTVFPNPASELLNIAMDLEKSSKVSIDLVSPAGKTLKHIVNKTMDAGNFSGTINIGDLAGGVYHIVFKAGSFTHVQSFIKQ